MQWMLRIRKYIIVASVILFIFPIASLAKSFTGFYLGAQIGANAFRQDSAFNVRLLDGTEVLTSEGSPGSGDFISSLLVGYSGLIRWFYLGGGLQGSLLTTETNFTEGVQSQGLRLFHIQLLRSYGIFITPGFRVSHHMLLYTLIGWYNAYFQLKDNQLAPFNVKKMRNGYKFGIGFDLSVSQQFVVQLQYAYIRYKRITETGLEVLGPGFVGILHASGKPISNQYTFAVIYYFN